MRRTLALSLLFINLAAFAQYTDPAAIKDLGGPQEFARRRAELAKQLKTGYTLLWARTSEPEGQVYREDNDFYYFTGLQDKGAVMLMDNATGEITIFEPVQHPRTKQFYGPNLLALSEQERAALGYKNVVPVHDFELAMSRIFGHANVPELWIRLGLPDKVDGERRETAMDYASQYASPFGDPLPGDRAGLKKLAERYPAVTLKDVTRVIDGMRNIKTPGEIAVLRRNGKISAEAQRRAIARAKPGMYEYQVEAEARYWMAFNGAQGVAYPAIVGSGPNSNTPHYFQNRRQMQANDIVVFDFGADLNHQTIDITRTFNVSGKFTPEQAKWYAIDLAAQKAVIAMLKPGNTYEQAVDAGREVFEQAGVGERWGGFPGHFVGLATHDVMRPSGPIKAGQVVAVEPILDFPEKQMHIRIEDTVLVTDGEPEILTSAVPKEMAELEKLVGSEAK